MEAYLGTEEIWQNSENILREIIKKSDEEIIEALGEAAFYGPKIDFMAKDAIGREHQVATIQLDMNMPERFDLYCINEKGEKERIVMIHAAIMGSIERFLSILIEHTAGAFPVWMSPVQVAIVPIRENHNKKAQEIFNILTENNIRVELKNEDDSLGKRINQAKAQKTPYVIVLGDKEVSSGNLTIEKRDGTKEELSLENFISKIEEEIKEKK